MVYADHILLARSIARRFNSPLSHMTGNDPTQTMIEHTINDISMLFGGSASGPARNESVITVKINIPAVTSDHVTFDDRDSGIGYNTICIKMSAISNAKRSWITLTYFQMRIPTAMDITQY